MSKFDGLLAGRNAEKPAIQQRKTPEGKIILKELPKADAPMVRIGRPRAKRSNPEYQQVTAYIRRSTYTAARKQLFDEGREFSELVEELVAGWVKARRA